MFGMFDNTMFIFDFTDHIYLPLYCKDFELILQLTMPQLVFVQWVIVGLGIAIQMWQQMKKYQGA